MSIPANTVQQDGLGTVTADQYNTYIQVSGFATGLQNFVGVSGMVVYIPGLVTYGDGGQGEFYWNAAGAANDGTNNIQPNGVSVGCWTRVGISPNSVLGPGMSTAGNIVAFNNATGTLVKDSGISLNSQAENLFLGTPSGAVGVPSFRALVSADLPVALDPSYIIGTATNNDAPIGGIGEYESASVGVGSAISLSNNVNVSTVSLSLTAGDWDVWGTGNFYGTASTVTYLAADISSTQNTVTGLQFSLPYTSGSPFGAGYVSGAVAAQRFPLAGTTTIYLNSLANFSGGTGLGFGSLYARRRR
ncbi:MAG: hypothetical protein WBG19_09670 [Thermoplasmata archaeon]